MFMSNDMCILTRMPSPPPSEPLFCQPLRNATQTSYTSELILISPIPISTGAPLMTVRFRPGALGG